MKKVPILFSVQLIYWMTVERLKLAGPKVKKEQLQRDNMYPLNTTFILLAQYAPS